MFDATLAPTLPRFSKSSARDDIHASLMDAGVVVIEDAAAPGVIETVRDELAPWFDRAYRGVGPFFGRRTKRFSGVFAKAASTAILAGDEFVLSIVERVLTGAPDAQRCDTIQLNMTQAIGIEPGQEAQVLHRDEVMFPFSRDYEVMVNVQWGLDPWRVDNGATRFVPGSQPWPRIRVPEPHEVAIATAPPGAALIWLGSTIHGGGANTSDSIRRGLAFSYTPGWLAQAERLLLSTPPHVARTLPRRVQRLIGYHLHKPNLGWIEERDPIEWLDGAFTDLAPAEDNLTPPQEALIQWRLAARPEGG